jgi:glycosyltransferase involved in cell wall biosynthesis
MKKILFIYDSNLSSLPPLLAIIDSLIDSYDLTFIVRDHEEVIEQMYKDNNIEFIAYNRLLPSNARFFRGINRLRRILFFRYHIPSLIKHSAFDLVWIVSAETAILLKNPIVEKKYFLNIYELYDVRTEILAKIKPIAQCAQKVIVPEFNRAYMLRFWLGLNETPTIIPNKPAILPQPSIEIPDQIKPFVDKKIILYQGYINRHRNLDAICEAIATMPDYVMILMGVSNDNYLSELKSKYPEIIHIGFIPPPFHLNVTSHAYIGIVTYEFTDLNGVYCAPNKIWEYAGYGVPMLANNIPGLIYTVGNAGAGCCIDMNNSKTIKKTIKQIDANYAVYRESAKIMFDSVDIKESILSAVKDII